MKSRRIPKQPTESKRKKPLLGKLLFPWHGLIFIILGYLLISQQGTAQVMTIIGFVGLIPSALLLLTQRSYLREEKEGRKMMHHIICYAVTIITVFFYTVALYRSNQLVLLARVLIVPGAALVYYSLFMNLQGKGRTDMRKRNTR